jgi:hypothetical protein
MPRRSRQLVDDCRIGLDRARRKDRRWSAADLIRERRNELTIDDGLDRVREQRIAFAEELQESCTTCRRRQTLRDVDEESPPAVCMGAMALSCHIEMPSGFIASVIIC